MVTIEILMKEGKIVRINELELHRYLNFFENSYEDNLEHCKAVMMTFPRWSIISGYYAMHDATKLFIAKNAFIKVEYEVHATTIKVLAELVKQPEVSRLMEKGYAEFISLANDLAQAKKERVKTQYYTGTDFMKAEYGRRASEFLHKVVEPYLAKIKQSGEIND